MIYIYPHFRINLLCYNSQDLKWSKKSKLFVSDSHITTYLSCFCNNFELTVVCCVRLVQLLSFAQTLQSSELSSVGLPDFPIHNLVKIVKILVCYIIIILIIINNYWLIDYLIPNYLCFYLK